MKMYRNLVLTLTFIVPLSIFCQNKPYDIYDSFIGEFCMYSSDKKMKEDILQIIKKEDTFYCKIKKSSDSSFYELTKISLDYFKSNFHKSLPNNTLILSDNKDLYVYYTSNKDKINQSQLEANYFIMTVVGPIDIYKKD